MTHSRPIVYRLIVCAIAALTGCSSAYYSAWEMLGQEKRDLLRSNVESVKHNLNAAAIGGLAADMEGIETDIEQLIADMRASIHEADSFLKTLPE